MQAVAPVLERTLLRRAAHSRSAPLANRAGRRSRRARRGAARSPREGRHPRGRVADVDAIENLQGSYGYYTDKMLWDEVLDSSPTTVRSRSARAASTSARTASAATSYSLSGGKQGPLEGVLNDHFQLQPIVTVAADGNSARARWRLFLLLGVNGAAIRRQLG